jgi:hypothetical protein
MSENSPKKRRTRDDLSNQTARTEKYSDISQTSEYYLSTMARSDPSEVKVTNHYKAKSAVSASRPMHASESEDERSDNDWVERPLTSQRQWGLLTTRLTTRQRKDLLQEKPLHPDLHQLREEVLGIGNNADVVVDMMNVQHEEHEQRDQQLEELEEEVEQEFLQELAGLALGVDQSAEVGMEVN